MCWELPERWEGRVSSLQWSAGRVDMLFHIGPQKIYQCCAVLPIKLSVEVTLSQKIRWGNSGDEFDWKKKM